MSGNLLEYTDHYSVLFRQHSPFECPSIPPLCGFPLPTSGTPQIFLKQIGHRSGRARTYWAPPRYPALVPIILWLYHGEVPLLLPELRAQLLQLLVLKKVDVGSESGFLRAQQLLELFQVRLLTILTLRQDPLLDQSLLGSTVVPVPLDEVVRLVLIPLDLLFYLT